jgi:hypothetical protein
MIEFIGPCMYKGWAIKSSPCTTTFNDLVCFYWTFIQLVTTFHKSLSLTGHSQLLTTLLLQLNCQLLLASRYIALSPLSLHICYRRMRLLSRYLGMGLCITICCHYDVLLLPSINCTHSFSVLELWLLSS